MSPKDKQHELKLLNARLRKRSGEVELEGRLISFLYELMRDHITPGQIEDIVRSIEISEAMGTSIRYSNGWLAKYAADLASRLDE
jgi:hypothetical protein